STYDGLSLAWAVAEHLQKNKVRTLFATHFHELTSLSETLSGVKNYNVSVKEWDNEIIFLHRIVTGGTDDSYGIYVAELAGIPKEVVKRSRQILKKLEKQKSIKDKFTNNKNDKIQLGIFTEETDNGLKDIKNDLISLDLNNFTPLDALNKINLWQQKLNNK
ncbi:MAG: DNA mismatch repair protein MutS, partial [Candidatus Omnitrophica bacterium]|nr:DNA mismatch repair protein MutS [Candidatus Omnitrophota bacterium]